MQKKIFQKSISRLKKKEALSNRGEQKLKKDIKKNRAKTSKNSVAYSDNYQLKTKAISAISYVLHLGFQLKKRKPAIIMGALFTFIVFNTISPALSITNTAFVVDDGGAVFVGGWGSSSYSSGFIGDGYRYNYAGDGSGTASWSFNIPESGSWEVFARWTSHVNRATNAPYKINYAGGSTVVRVNQEVNGGEWFSLGLYNFNAGSASVMLSDAANGVVIADAIKLIPTTISPISSTTNMDNHGAVEVGVNVPSSDFDKSSIFFEYGAEYATVVPPFDFAGANGAGSTYGAGYEIVDTHVKSGDYSLRIYQPDPPKSDAQRRVGLKLFGDSHNKDEFYASWWMYFDDDFETMINAPDRSWGPVIGGGTLYWRILSDPATYNKGLRFRFTINSGMKTHCSFSTIDDGSQPASSEFRSASAYGDMFQLQKNTWHQFQVYIKKGDNTSGRVMAWVDGTLITDAKIATDPEYYGEPQGGEEYTYGTGYWTILVESYSSEDTLSHSIWLDDVVIATEYIPISYKVIR